MVEAYILITFSLLITIPMAMEERRHSSDKRYYRQYAKRRIQTHI